MCSRIKFIGNEAENGMYIPDEVYRKSVLITIRQYGDSKQLIYKYDLTSDLTSVIV